VKEFMKRFEIDIVNKSELLLYYNTEEEDKSDFD